MIRLLLVAFLVVLSSAGESRTPAVVNCDIAILGGSAASLGAAITAAEANASLTVCFTEITDWPGGQLSSGGVSAIDFGPWNHFAPNLPRTFNSLWEYTNMTNGATAGCWVSYDCYLPPALVEGWVFPTLEKLPNLKVLLRTVAVATTRVGERIDTVTVITRKPVEPAKEWALPLSETLLDWYSPQDSTLFTKTVTQLKATVFIDATEFADVLVTSGSPFTQGAEVPHETSWETDPTCGFAATLVFFMTLRDHRTNASAVVPPGGDAGIPFPYEAWASQEQWNESWTYRRGVCNGSQSMTAVNVGDVTQQNWINDVDSGYFFEPLRWSSANNSWRGWAGAVNLTTQRLLEERALGTFHFLLNTTGQFADRLDLSRISSGTPTGLSKMPYLRDSRRAFGLDGFRFTYAAEDFYNKSNPYVGEQFYDVVALGDYLYADMHKLSFCELPEYQWKNETKPYFIPFRALTVMNASNLLVAGKTMAQSLHANAATRLHPSEWASGVAAGAAAVVMCEQSLTSRGMLERVTDLQDRLRQLGQPLAWTPPGPLPPLPIGFGCVAALGRCVGVTNETAFPAPFPSSDCNASCLPLGPHEWLITKGDWAPAPHGMGSDLRSGAVMVSHFPTVVTKSVAASIILPPAEKMSVCGGSRCQLVTGALFENHYLCSFSG
jgi:hypothetical protein